MSCPVWLTAACTAHKDVIPISSYPLLVRTSSTDLYLSEALKFLKTKALKNMYFNHWHEHAMVLFGLYARRNALIFSEVIYRFYVIKACALLTFGVLYFLPILDILLIWDAPGDGADIVAGACGDISESCFESFSFFVAVWPAIPCEFVIWWSKEEPDYQHVNLMIWSFLSIIIFNKMKTNNLIW